MFEDLTKDTWSDILEELLSEDNFLLQREIDNEMWTAPAFVSLPRI